MAGPKPQTLALKISGLFTNPNTFSEVPPGLTLANTSNVVLDRDSILGSRRGFPQYGVSPDGGTTIESIFDFKDTLILHDENGILSYDSAGNGSVWTAYSGTYESPGEASNRIIAFQSNKNLYFTTSQGVYKLEDPTSEPRVSGAPPGLGGTGTTAGSTGFMTTGTNVAYRVIWGYRDSNENLILGAPSDRIVVSNTSGGLRNVLLSFFVPQDITTDWFYQVYRSAGSASINDEPDDELQLVFESSPTSGEITASLVSITDETPDNLRGAIIYTAPSINNDGILASNFQPPYAAVACTFAQHAFYGNTRTKHILSSTLISGDPVTGLQLNDTIVFTQTGGSSFTITAKASENAALGYFKLEASLTPAENIESTARSIVNILNSYPTNTWVAAYYRSGFDALPGVMVFERITLDSASFYITSNRGDAFRPVLPSSGSNYNNTSRNEAKQNRVYFSKLQQPEAVPTLNVFDIGDPEEPIQALVPLREGIIVLKTDGIYRIGGFGDSSFSVSLIDNTVRIIAPRSAAILSNKVFFFSSQGVVATTDAGAEIVSRPIESEILELSSALFPNFPTVTFAQAYESDRKYILWVPSTSSDTAGTQAFVFNTLTGDWTRWTKFATAAIVKQDDDKLYIAGQIANGTDQYVFQERKNLNLSDYADEQYELTLSAVNGLELTLNDTSNLEVGYTLKQVLGESIITSIESSTVVLVDSLEDFVLGPITAYRPIQQYFESNQFDAGNPGIMKHWADCSVVFRQTNFDDMELGFSADTTNEERTVTLIPNPGTGGWGTFPWGTTPWGVSRAVSARLRTSVPKQAMRSNWLRISGRLNQAFTDFSIAGISLTFSTMSSRQKGSSRS